MLEEKIKCLVAESTKLITDVVDHASSISLDVVKRIATLHKELYSFEKSEFYKEFFNHFFEEEKQHYSEIIEKLPDKEVLECQEESVIVLTVNRLRDLVNHTHKLFHIDENVRDIWEVIEKKI